MNQGPEQYRQRDYSEVEQSYRAERSSNKIAATTAAKREERAKEDSPRWYSKPQVKSFLADDDAERQDKTAAGHGRMSASR